MLAEHGKMRSVSRNSGAFASLTKMNVAALRQSDRVRWPCIWSVGPTDLADNTDPGFGERPFFKALRCRPYPDDVARSMFEFLEASDTFVQSMSRIEPGAHTGLDEIPTWTVSLRGSSDGGRYEA